MTAVVLVLIFSVCFASAVLASSEALSNLQNSAPTELAARSNLMLVLGGIVRSVLALLGVALIITIIYAGVIWGFTAQGDPTKIKKAQQMITSAVIGLLIVMAAYAITAFVYRIASGTTDGSSPTGMFSGWGGM